MKAKFFFLGLCALALAACSIDEVSQVNDTNAIQFKATASTRASVTTTNNLQEFTVWAWNDSNEFMDHVTATKQGNGTFTTSPYYFWPTGSVDFYALAPASVGYGVDNATGDELAYIGGEITIDEDDMGGTHFTYSGNVAQADIAEDNIVINTYIPGAAGDQIDLCYAITKDRSSGAVPMNFRHALSQVTFKAKDVNEDFVVDIAGVSVCSVYKHGTYTLSGVPSTTTQLETDSDDVTKIAGTQGVWSTEDFKARFEAGITAQTLATDGTVVDITSDPLMLLPQEVEGWDVLADAHDGELGAYIAVLCHVTEHGSTLWPNANEDGNVETIDGTDYAYIAMPVDVAWEEGYRYTYTIVFGEGLGYYPPDDPNWDLDGTPVLVPITFNVTVDEFQDAGSTEVDTTTDLSYIEVKSQAELEGAIRMGYQEIVLEDDIDLEATNLFFDYDCVLDLNDHTLTGVDLADDEDPCGNGVNSVIFISGGTLTVTGDGTITTEGSGTDSNGGTGSGDTGIFWLNGGNLIINGGTYYSSSWQDPTGEVYTAASACVYVQYGYAYIYDGEFYSGYSKTFKETSILNCQDTPYKNKEANIYCYGGTYHGQDPAANNAEDSSRQFLTNFCADGYSTVKSEEVDDLGLYTYTVILTTVATPADLSAALAAGASEITVSESFSVAQGDEGQGSSSGYFRVTSDCTITLEDGVTISLDEMSSIANYAFFIAKEGTLTIEGNGTLQSNGSTKDMGCMCFWVDGGDLVINGGNFYSAAWAEESSSDTAACVYVNLGTATIYGGNFYGSHNVTAYTGSSYLLNCTDKNYKSSTANIVCYGGEFCDFDPAYNYAEGEGTNFCATGYTTKMSDEPDSDGWYWYSVVEE